MTHLLDQLIDQDPDILICPSIGPLYLVHHANVVTILKQLRREHGSEHRSWHHFL